MRRFLILALLFVSVLGMAQTQLFVTAGAGATSCTSGAPCGTINRAIAVLTSTGLPAAGAVVNVAAGNYTLNTTTISLGGPSITGRLIIKCTTPRQCFLGSGSRIFFSGTNTNNVDLIGFDIGPCPSCDSGIESIGSTAGPGTYNSLHIINNRVHDIGQDVTEGNPGNPILGCPQNGMITIGPPHGVTYSLTDIQYIGNRLENYGRLNVGCNVGEGAYCGSANCKIQNNIISGITTGGIQTYDQPSNGDIANNLVFNSGNCMRFGGNSGSSAPGRNTFINNTCGPGITNQAILWDTNGAACPVSSALYLDNLFIPALPSNLCGATNLASSSTATFVAFPTDLHLKAGSNAIGAGTSSCVSGGQTPCVPSTDYDGKPRPSSGAQDIGPYVFAVSVSPPSNVTATVN